MNVSTNTFSTILNMNLSEKHLGLDQTQPLMKINVREKTLGT